MSNSTLSIIVFADQKSSYTEILRKILRSDLDRERYEIIFLGSSHKGFQQTTISKIPLVRAFYDDVLNSAQKINGAIAEAHCDRILFWPGVTFPKVLYKPMPEDVNDARYYLLLWVVMNGVKVTLDKGKKMVGKHSYRCNLKDTLRFLYKVGDCPARIQVWYLGLLLKAIGLRIIGRR